MILGKTEQVLREQSAHLERIEQAALRLHKDMASLDTRNNESSEYHALRYGLEGIKQALSKIKEKKEEVALALGRLLLGHKEGA